MFLLQHSIIFIDSEGEPTQELSALEMDLKSGEIVDVFHSYAYTNKNDWFARKHIHGLDPLFLKQNGYENSAELFTAFQCWMKRKCHIVAMYGNAPNKEKKELNLDITDIGLDNWATRHTKLYHQIAVSYKKKSLAIHTQRCTAKAHSRFQSAIVRHNNVGDAVREQHGYHCSLYDCYELYLFFHLSHVSK